MPRLPDLVRDSSLNTEFRDSITVHSYREIDAVGRRFLREEHWESGRVLGRGGFGQVHLQKCVAGAKQNSLRAVKVVNKPADTGGTLNLNRELEALVKFSNDRYRRWFVKTFGWFEDPTSIFITMEYCRYGDLHHYLVKKSPVPAEEVQQLAYQILEGLDQMHQNDFAHRDLKPGNILIKSMPPEERWWVVLADFGISKKADESNGPTTAIQGTTAFMAPELLGYLDQIKPRSIADFKAADMWALGEILFQMLTSETTFRNPPDLVKYCTGQKQFPSDRLTTSATDEGRDFITSIMAALPRERRNTAQCIQHSWMELLRVEEELTTVNLEQNNPQQSSPSISETSSNESASAQWTSPSNVQDETATQATAQGRTEMPLHLNYSSADETQLQSTPNDLSIRFHPYDDKFSTLSGGIAQVMEPTEYMRTFRCISFSPDNRWIAMAFGEADDVELLSAESGKLVHTIKNTSEKTWANIPSHLAFSSDSRQLLVVSDDQWVGLASVESGELMWSLGGEYWGSSQRCLAVSPDNRWLIIQNNHRTISLWSTESGTAVKMLMDTEQLKTLMNDEQLATLSNYDKRSIYKFSANGSWLAIADFKGSAPQLWSTEPARLVHTLDACLYSDPDGVSHLSFSPDSRLLSIISYNCTTVWLWSAESGTLAVIHTGIYGVHNLTFSPDSRWLAAALYTHTDKAVGLWSTESRRQKFVFGRQERVVLTKHLAFSPDSNRLVVIDGEDSKSTLWSTGSGILVRKLTNYRSGKRSGDVIAWAFSPDNRWLAVAFRDSTVQIWSDESATVIEVPKNGIYRVRLTFSLDSKWLAITYGRALQLWSTKGEILVKTLNFEPKGFFTAAFSPDSRRLVTAVSGDATARLWSIDGE